MADRTAKLETRIEIEVVFDENQLAVSNLTTVDQWRRLTWTEIQ